MIKFVTASHDEDILFANLFKSPIFDLRENGRISPFVSLNIICGSVNISQAYNQIDPVIDYMGYVHHDVYLPASFENDLFNAFNIMAKVDPNWGVLGVAGVKLVDGKKQNIGRIQDRGREWGSPAGLPAEVDTLDELLLITHGDFQFDEQFDLHFYGADICMQAKLQGRKCYAINAYCHHNSGLPLGFRSQSFRDCEAKFRAKYINHLPIITTCSLIS
jgi:hypothetical protein